MKVLVDTCSYINYFFSRNYPQFLATLAQLVECPPCKRIVASSILAGGSRITPGSSSVG